MSGLWSNNEKTPEGKYPIVLRRDGTPVEVPFFVILLHDPCACAALQAYADKAEELGLDPDYVADLRTKAQQSLIWAERAKSNPKPPDPDAPRHRQDNPVLIAWAQRLLAKNGHPLGL